MDPTTANGCVGGSADGWSSSTSACFGMDVSTAGTWPKHLASPRSRPRSTSGSTRRWPRTTSPTTGPQKAYRRTETFAPAFIGESVDRYLLQLVAIENRWMRAEDTWFDTTPPLEVITLRRRPTNPKVLLRVLDAVRERLEIDIEYDSLTGSARAVTNHRAPCARPQRRSLVRSFMVTRSQRLSGLQSQSNQSGT